MIGMMKSVGARVGMALVFVVALLASAPVERASAARPAGGGAGGYALMQPGLRDRGGVINADGVIDVSTRGAVPGDGTDQSIPIMLALLDAKAAGGGVVTITKPGTYIIGRAAITAGLGACATYDSALTIGSNCTIMLAQGVTLQKATSASCYMLCNDVQTTSGTGAGNTDINIIGGTWDGNDSASSATYGATRATRWLGNGIFMIGVDRLRVTDVRIINTLKYGLSFANNIDVWITRVHCVNAISGGDGIHADGPVTRCTIESLNGTTADNLLGFTNSAGTYLTPATSTGALTGGTTNAAPGTTLTKTNGFTGMVAGQYVAITSGTGATPGYYLIDTVTNASNVILHTSPGASASAIAFFVCGYEVTDAGHGDFTDITIRGVKNAGGSEPIRFTGTSLETSSNVRIMDVSGTITAGSLIKLSDDAVGQLTGCVMRGFVIDGVDASGQNNSAVVNIDGSGVKDVIIRNLRIRTAGCVGVNVPSGVALDRLVIDAMTTATNVQQTAKFISVAGTIANLTVNNCYARLGAGGKAIDIAGVITYGQWSNTTVSNPSGNGVGLNFANTTTKSVLHVTGSAFIGGGAGTLYGIHAAARGEVYLCNVRFESCDLGIYNHMDASSLGSVGSPLFTVGGSGMVEVISTNNLIYNNSGTAYMRINHAGMQVPGDRISATPTTNDVFYNTSAAGSGGQPSTNWGTLGGGLVIYSGGVWNKSGRPRRKSVKAPGRRRSGPHFARRTSATVGGVA